MSAKEGKYIYCIIASGGVSEKFSSIGIGDRGDEVYSVCYEDIAAVVSNSPIVSYRTSRDNLMAHEKAIEEVMSNHIVLPVKFATIAENEEKIRTILKNEYRKFKNMLGKINNKKELGLKAMFKDDVIYRDILEKRKDICELKAAIIDKAPEKTYHQRMKIGEMVESALKDEVSTCREDILEILSPLAVEVKVNPVFGEKMVINAAFLVENSSEEAFDIKVNDIDVKYGGKMKLKYVGNIPPFNFVNLIIQV